MLKPLFSRWGFAYMSVFVIIAFLVISSNIATQLTFEQEVRTRALASAMDLQELRTQNIFRNSLLAIIPTPQLAQYNVQQIDPVASLAKNLTDVEATNKMLIGPEIPVATSKSLGKLQPDFLLMDKAGHAVLANVKSGDIKDAAQQVAVLWPPEQRYLTGTYNAYQDLTKAADDQIAYIIRLECVILVCSIATLIAEARLVAWPLLRDHYNMTNDLQGLRLELQAIQQKEDS